MNGQSLHNEQLARHHIAERVARAAEPHLRPAAAGTGWPSASTGSPTASTRDAATPPHPDPPETFRAGQRHFSRGRSDVGAVEVRRNDDGVGPRWPW